MCSEVCMLCSGVCLCVFRNVCVYAPVCACVLAYLQDGLYLSLTAITENTGLKILAVALE